MVTRRMLRSATTRFGKSGSGRSRIPALLRAETEAAPSRSSAAAPKRWPHPTNLHALAAKHRSAREEPLVAGPLAPEIIVEFEGPFSEFEHCNVGGCTHFQGAAVVEDRECAGRVDGRAGDHLIERHPQHEELRHHVGKVDYLGGAALRSPVRRKGIGQEAGL